MSLRVSKPDLPWPDDPGFVDGYADACLRGVVRQPAADAAPDT